MIDKFDGEYFFLSNFYMSPVEFEGLKYSCSESAFQAMKVKDIEDRKRFCNLNPGEAKRLGKHVNLRDDWEDVKHQVMYNICKQKFLQNPNIRAKLIETGNEYIIEGNNWHDNEWGYCKCPHCEHKEHKNNLGKILMQLREEFSK